VLNRFDSILAAERRETGKASPERAALALLCELESLLVRRERCWGIDHRAAMPLVLEAFEAVMRRGVHYALAQSRRRPAAASGDYLDYCG